MKILSFYIIVKGHKVRKFESANALHRYINIKKLPLSAVIQLKEDDKVVGEILVKRYLTLTKNEKSRM